MAWYNSNWQYRIPVDILYTQVPGDLTDMTVRLDLSDAPASFWTNVKSDGSDIVFTSSNGTTKLKRELEYIDGVLDEGAIHVRVASISSVSNTRLYLYYGYSSATETDDSDAFRSEHIVVAHMHGAPSGAGSCKDSSQVDNDGNSTSASSSSTNPSLPSDGKCWESDGTDNLAEFPDDVDYDVSGDLTVVASFNVDDTGTHGIASRDNNSWHYFIGSAKLRMRISSSSRFEVSYSYSSGTWYRGAVTFSDSGDRVRHYINGSQQGSDVACTQSLQTGSTDINIGFENSTTPNYLDGEMNELKIVNEELSADWLLFEYRFLNSPSTVYSYGTQEEQPTININSIPSSEAWGSPTIQPGNVNVAINSIASSEAWGSPALEPGNVDIAINSIPSSEAWGNFVVAPEQFITMNSISSSEAWGSPQIDLNVASLSIPSSEAWGLPILIRGNVDVAPNSIASSEAWGNPTIQTGNVDIAINSIVSSEAWGNPSLSLKIEINSIESSEAWGNPTIEPGSAYININSISSSETWGSPTVTPESVYITPNGIESSEAWGNPTIEPGNVNIAINSILSSEAWGNPSLSVGSANITPNSISSSEAWGQPTITTGNVDVSINSIPSSEAWGSFSVAVSGIQVSMNSIPSSESFGNFLVSTGNVDVAPNSIASSETWGEFSIEPGNVDVSINSITSSEAWGLMSLTQIVEIESIPSSEAWGSPGIIPGNVNISPNSITSNEAWGLHTIRNVLVIDMAGAGIPSSEAWGNPTVTVVELNEFDELRETDLDEGIFNLTEYAQNVTYIYKDGSSFTTKIIFFNESISVDPDTGANILSRSPMAYAISSEFTTMPDKGDKMIVNGKRYQITEASYNKAGVTTFDLHHERTV